jgi:hypothetical protein
MDPRPAATRDADRDAVDFIRFCYHRRRVGWPELYDEMCAVAGRGLYHGLCADDLADRGIGFGLFEMPALAALVRQVVTEEQALRRPVAVIIQAEEPDVMAHMVVDEGPTDVAVTLTPEPVIVPEPIVVNEPVRHEPVIVERPARPEAPVRFIPVPAGA